jgi:hypothetical protein
MSFSRAPSGWSRLPSALVARASSARPSLVEGEEEPVFATFKLDRLYEDSSRIAGGGLVLGIRPASLRGG